MDIPEFIKELIQPPPKVLEKSKNALEKIKDLFPLEVVKIKSEKTEDDFDEV